jgi:glycosyltransferase involved in cell wall biosynthesis
MPKLRIAQVAPLFESVPPQLYGGTERIVSYLTDALVDMGHEVTLFASGDSVTRAKLRPVVFRALRLGRCQDPLAMHVIQLQDVIDCARQFDIIHFHTDYLHFPISRLLQLTTLTTLHGRLDMPEMRQIFSRFINMPVSSISQAQRQPLPMANWIGTVYHGLPPDLYRKGPGDGDYALFLGRIAAEKGPDRAIEIARRAGMRLKIAAKVDDADRQYFEQQIKPLLDQPHVEFIGEVGEAVKGQLLGSARALLFPIDWPEPFGLVMLEAMASGTPVIAFAKGSVPEIITPERTGCLVRNVEEAADALRTIGNLCRDACRQEFENRFGANRMAEEYVKLYEQLLAAGSPVPTKKMGTSENYGKTRRIGEACG